MPLIFKRLALITSIAASFVGNNAAADKAPPFRPPAAAELPHRITNGQVTIAADPYISGEKMKAAFGKLIPYQYGVLPILVVFQNDSGQTIQIKGMKAEYVLPNGQRVEATPARDVRYSRPTGRPNIPVTPIPLPKHKNPLDAWEIEGHALAAEAIPAGNPAYGFLYFQASLERGATLYLSGMTEARTGKELLFFEIPLQ
jgi:hypothetical protein